MEVIESAIKILHLEGFKIKFVSDFTRYDTIGKNILINGIEYLLLEHVADFIVNRPGYVKGFVTSLSTLGKKKYEQE